MTPHSIEGRNDLMRQSEKLGITEGFSISYLMYSMKWQLPKKYPLAQRYRPQGDVMKEPFDSAAQQSHTEPCSGGTSDSSAHWSMSFFVDFGSGCEQLSPVYALLLPDMTYSSESLCDKTLGWHLEHMPHRGKPLTTLSLNGVALPTYSSG